MRKIHSEETLTKSSNDIDRHVQGLNTGGEQVKLYRTCTDVGYYLGNLYSFSGYSNKQDKHQRNVPKQRAKYYLDQLVSRGKISFVCIVRLHRSSTWSIFYTLTHLRICEGE